MISTTLFGIANNLQEQKYFRFAEQLRGATLSISNNIAEGSGSASRRDFANFLNIAHRSVSEVVNILIHLQDLEFINNKSAEILIKDLDHLSRRINSFRKSLLSKKI